MAIHVTDLACALLELAASPHRGIHHVAGAQAVSRYELGALRSHLTRVRQVLEVAEPGSGARRLVHRSGGYRLAVDPGRIDVYRFQRLTALARAPDVPDRRRLELLRDARRLPRGEPLAGLAGRWAALVRRTWLRDQTDATIAWARAELRTGDPAATLPVLGALAAENPLVESLAAVLMRALVAAGRTADALEHFEEVRRQLAEDLGTDPGAELRATHLAVLRGEPDATPAGRR